jgi:hypothetical protein
MGRTATRPADRPTLDEARPHQSVESLTHGRRRDTELIGQLADLQRGVPPEEFHHGGVGIAKLTG